MKRILAVAFTLLVLTGCLGQKGLVGSEYQLVSGSKFLNIIIGFRDGGKFYSNSINVITGVYQVQGDKLTLAVQKRTHLAAQEAFSSEYMGIEKKYVSMLPKVSSYKIEGKKLTLFAYDGRSLTFERVGNAGSNQVGK